MYKLYIFYKCICCNAYDMTNAHARTWYCSSYLPARTILVSYVRYNIVIRFIAIKLPIHVMVKIKCGAVRTCGNVVIVFIKIHNRCVLLQITVQNISKDYTPCFVRIIAHELNIYFVTANGNGTANCFFLNWSLYLIHLQRSKRTHQISFYGANIQTQWICWEVIYSRINIYNLNSISDEEKKNCQNPIKSMVCIRIEKLN